MIYVGIIEAILPPNHRLNTNKYQYEYRVNVTIERQAQVVVNCMKSDKFGTFDDYEDEILLIGSKVFICFVNEARTYGIIIGAGRNYLKNMDSSAGKYWTRRYNKFEIGINKFNSFFAKSDAGPNFWVKPDEIILDDSSGQRIKLNKKSKTITIESNQFKVEIKQNHETNVSGNLSKNIKGNVTINVSGKVNINCNEATIKAKNKAEVEAKNVKLGSGASESVIKGDSFMKLFNNHVHIGNLGAPTSPPTAAGTPMTKAHLSRKVKVE